MGSRFLGRFTYWPSENYFDRCRASLYFSQIGQSEFEPNENPFIQSGIFFFIDRLHFERIRYSKPREFANTFLGLEAGGHLEICLFPPFFDGLDRR